MPPIPANEAAFSFHDLTKVYRVYPSPGHRLVEILTGRRRHAEVRALDGVSGEVPRGSVVGLIGENGSGKSTLLKILAGTTEATAGQVARSGRIASILELGSSFHPEVTGRRNVILQAALMGLSRKEVDAAVPEVEAFAELGDFFDRPVKTYSSGMNMRLAFAAATAVLPDTVILDEALAVGDGHFQKKCVDRIFDLKKSGRTILFCSHAMYYVSTLCDRVIWLNAGRVAGEGGAQDVVLRYERFLSRKEGASDAEAGAGAPAALQADRHGRLTSLRLVGKDGETRASFVPREPWAIEVRFQADDPRRSFHIHVSVGTRDQVTCFAADSRLDGAGPFSGSTEYVVRISLPSLPLAKGEFVVNAYLGDEKALAVYDTRSDVSFHVDAEGWKSGLFEVQAVWERLG
jgi:lipopolysaccharide transport system ATP-binding protein